MLAVKEDKGRGASQHLRAGIAFLNTDGWDEGVLRWSSSLVWLYKPRGCAAAKKERRAEKRGKKKKKGGRRGRTNRKVEGDRESLKTKRKRRDGGGRPKTERVEGDGESKHKKKNREKRPKTE